MTLNRNKTWIAFVLAIAVIGLGGYEAAGQDVSTLERVQTVEPASVADDGTFGEYPVTGHSLSGDGNHVGLITSSPLTADDVDLDVDCFIRNLSTGAIENALPAKQIHLNYDGSIAVGKVSEDLIAGDTNSWSDLYVINRSTGQMELATVTSDEAQVRNFESLNARVSGSGRFVVYQSGVTTLVPGDYNRRFDVFVRDRVLGTTTRVSVATDGSELAGHSLSPDVSHDGRWVVFSTSASAVSEDLNLTTDVYLHDRDVDEDGVFDEAGAIATTRISGGFGGADSNGVSDRARISANGAVVVFQSTATNLTDATLLSGVNRIFLYRVNSGEVEMISSSWDGSALNGSSIDPDVSDDGRVVVYSSRASNIVMDDANGFADIFAFDRWAGEMFMVSRGVEAGAGGLSILPQVSGEGTVISFETTAGNFDPSDLNGQRDVYVATLGLVDATDPDAEPTPDPTPDPDPTPNPDPDPTPDPTPDPGTDPVADLEDVADEIDQLVAGGDLSNGQGNSIIKKIEKILESIDDSNSKGAINVLNALSNQLTSYIVNGIVSVDVGLEMLAKVDALNAYLMGL